MNAKMIAVIAVVAVVVVGGIAAVAIMNNKSDSEEKDKFEGVGLKVLGNVNKDTVINADDYNEIKSLIDDGKSASDYPLADANNDGTLDAKDLEVIQNVIDGNKTTIWHINYHDADSNGTMDTELVSTTIPVTSTIMTGSANNFMMFTLMQIPAGTVVKGACYSTSNDQFLYKTNYLNKDLVENLGSKSYEIEFENGKIGSSNIIAEKSVTCLVTDWNRTYIENESAFESAGVDVVRIAAASFDKDVYTHTISLLGIVFGQTEQAKKVLELYDNTYKEINDVVSALSESQKKKAVASSMDGGLSSKDSDYTAICTAAGAEFGLDGYDFGGSSLIYVSDNLGVFDTRSYSFDNIVHIRTALTYGSTTAEVASYWATYANAMSLWEHAYDGQVLISGSIPVPCRVAYAAYAIYHSEVPDTFTEEWAKTILSGFEQYYWVDASTATNKTLALTSYNYAVTVTEDVIVKDKNGNAITSGDKFPYGTELTIEAVTPNSDYTLVASGSNVTDGKFLVVNNIKAQYVKNTVLQALSTAASSLVSSYSGIYMTDAVANAESPGSVTITNPSYTAGANRTVTINFAYYDTEEDADAAYATNAATVDSKVKKDGVLKDNNYLFDATGLTGATAHNDITLGYTSNVYTNKAYTGGSTIYVTAHYKNIVLTYSTYVSYYTFDADFAQKTAEQGKAYFDAEVTQFATALENAMAAVYAS